VVGLLGEVNVMREADALGLHDDGGG
jgi:hypothetical protein